MITSFLTGNYTIIPFMGPDYYMPTAYAPIRNTISCTDSKYDKLCIKLGNITVTHVTALPC